MRPNQSDREMVPLGRIAGLYGVRGWVKVYSDTSPRENILQYSPWYIGGGDDWRPYRVEGKKHGKGVVVRIEGVADRDQAEPFLHKEIAVQRSQLPRPEAGEYYWFDLEGLKVITEQGVELGKVDHLFETGSNDVIVVAGERERLIPYVRDDVIKSIDLDEGVMVVDWDPEF